MLLYVCKWAVFDSLFPNIINSGTLICEKVILCGFLCVFVYLSCAYTQHCKYPPSTSVLLHGLRISKQIDVCVCVRVSTQAWGCILFYAHGCFNISFIYDPWNNVFVFVLFEGVWLDVSGSLCVHVFVFQPERVIGLSVNHPKARRGLALRLLVWLWKTMRLRMRAWTHTVERN